MVSLRDREPVRDCRGPLVNLSFTEMEISTLGASLMSEVAQEFLWSKRVFGEELLDRMMFSLCCAHWLDVAWLGGMNALRWGRKDWMAEASSLTDWVMLGADWDRKEMSNMLTWQRVPLT